MNELLQPDPRTLIVSRHPNHHLGDRVTVQFDDAVTGQRYLLALDTGTAEYLSQIFASALHSPKVIAAVDQAHAAQRDR